MSESHIIWICSAMARHSQINSNSCKRSISKGRLWSVVLFYCASIKRRPYEIIILCSSFIPSIDVLSIVSWSRWLVPFWFLKWSYIMLTILITFLNINISKWQKDRSDFCRNFIFSCVWAKKTILYILQKIFSLCFSYNSVKWGLLRCLSFHSNSMAGKILGLELLLKMLSSNQIP